jgi:transcription elongation GreA/GreB family factor
VPPSDDTAQVRFGLRVTIRREGGPEQSFVVVGQDEADPRQGLLSYVAPLARALIGREVGEVVSVGASETEIVRIETVPDEPG